MCHVLLNGCATDIKVQSHVITSLDSFFNLLTFAECVGSIVSLFLFSVSVLSLGQVALKFGLPQASLVRCFDYFIGRRLV